MQADTRDVPVVHFTHVVKTVGGGVLTFGLNANRTSNCFESLTGNPSKTGSWVLGQVPDLNTVQVW